MEFFEKIKILYFRYERHISSAALVFGFTVDSFTLQRIDLFFENLIFLIHLFVVGIGIIFLNLYEGGVVGERYIKSIRPWLPLPIQFSLGALFSGFLIFYSRSASFVVSWPILFFLLLLLIGNEFFRSRYSRLVFQVSMYFVAIFSYTIFFVPVVMHSIGADTFLISGVVSLVLIGAFIYILSILAPKRMQGSRKFLYKSIGGIFLIINILYFLNIIPPIPLALKEGGVYHSVTRVGSTGYAVTYEQQHWYEYFRLHQIIHVTPGARLYFYSAVFAPTDLNTNIVHRWEYFDEGTNEWSDSLSVLFPIIGGRDGGYRGYSVKTNITPGRWRVRVETTRGQLLGRQTFIVEYAQGAVLTKTVIQ